jgi:NADPH:quinone reductase
MLPRTMKALRLHQYQGIKSLRIEDVPLPVLESDEILIKVAASPINPSDDLFCEGLYKIQVSLPMTPGFEGAGTVVAAGSSYMARRLMGKWVASATQRGDGFWAEYVKVRALEAMPFDPEALSPEQAAMSFVNPLSAMGLIEPLIKGQHQAMVQTAAASQLGRMIARLAKRHNLTVIHCVHRKELIPILTELGAKHVLVTTEKDFVQKLRDLSASLNATYAIDAVGGTLTGQLADALPNHSTIAVYGALAKEAVAIDPGAFIFKDQKIEGFWLGTFLSKKSFLSQFLFVWRAKQNLKGDLTSSITRTIPLVRLPELAASGLGPASAGKTVLKP